MTNLLVTLPLTDRERQYLGTNLPDVQIRYASQPDTAELRWAEVILGNLPTTAATYLSSAQWLHSPSVGLDAYETWSQDAPRVLITNSKGVMDHAVAEHCLALMLALTRQIPMLVEAQRGGKWARDAFAAGRLGSIVHGKHAHLLGYGAIARTLAAKLTGLGMSVTAYRRRAGPADGIAVRQVALSTLTENVSTADVLISLLPLTPDTVGLVDRDVLAALTQGSYVLSLGRGAVIDQAALVDALASGRIAGAGLDVFESEPLPSDSPLWRLPNVILSPHVAGRFDDEMMGHIGVFLERFQQTAVNLPRFTGNAPVGAVEPLRGNPHAEPRAAKRSPCR
jgi:phosphoglycerate dehydrogenase-like enzyme